MSKTTTSKPAKSSSKAVPQPSLDHKKSSTSYTGSTANTGAFLDNNMAKEFYSKHRWTDDYRDSGYEDYGYVMDDDCYVMNDGCFLLDTLEDYSI